MGNISQRARDVRDKLRQGKIGELAFVSKLDELISRINSDPQAKQVDTITVDSAADDTDYTVTINGFDVTIDSGTGATTTSIAAALAAAINDDARIRGQVAASALVADVTLTGTWPGETYTLTESDANLSTASVTAAATADEAAFGRLILENGFDATEGNDPLGKVAKSTALAAQVDSYVMVYDALVEVEMFIEIEGETYSGSIAMAAASDVDTEMALLVAEINTALPANTVLAAYVAASDTITLTAELAGKPFKSWVTFRPPEGATVDTGAATKTSTAGIGTDVTRAAAGVSEYRYDEEVTTVGGEAVSYPPNVAMSVIQRGHVWVENSQGVSQGDDVYVELDGSGSNYGKFYNTSSSTRALLPGARWERDCRSDEADGIAVLSCRFGL